MKSIKTWILIGLLSIPIAGQSVYAQTINIDTFLDLAQRNHPFFIKEAMQAEIERKNRQRFLGAQDWVLSSTPTYVHQKPITTSAFAPTTLDIFTVGATAEKAYWRTGGRFSVEWSSQVTDQTIPDIIIPTIGRIPTGPSRLYQHGISVAYSQPLLQNKWGRLDRLEYELGKYNIDFAQLQALENQENFLLDLSIRFLDWALLTEQIEIARERLRLAEEQLDQTTRMRRANLVDEVDVLRAEDATRIAKQNIVLLESGWKAKQAELAVLSKSTDLYGQSPEFDLYALKRLPTADEAVSQLRLKSRLLQVLLVRKQQLEYQREGFVEISMPQLFLNIGAGLQEGENEFGESLGLDKPDIFISLAFSYPLGNRTALADIKTTDSQIRQLEEDIKSIELDLESASRNLLIQINELEKVLALNLEQIESARQKTAEEQKLYDQGRGQLTFVIQARDNEENAKLTYAQNAKFYHELILQHRALLDELLPSE
ncbi:MAG: TolC family protein [Candidatus Latescibacteria bacterium]|nr:TolC family protein [Candidatus Latescibacterota bacterium]NIO55295.1 TolC family protein [Candidatus Latescibacterota bacterium]